MLTMLTLGLLGAQAPAPKASLRPLDLEGDVRVDRRVAWRGRHVRVRGNLILARGGALTVEDSVVELRNATARQFRVVWEGGRLVTRRATIGGTLADGAIRPSNLELLDGEWDARDTTVRYVYGITFSHAKRGRLRATNLTMGPNPDSIIMTGRGDVVLRDSTYCISLTMDASSGGVARFDLPRNQPIRRVFDGSNVPGAGWRLELRNVRVPTWWLFVGGVSSTGPPCEVRIGGCEWFIPSIMAHDLRGEFRLPERIGEPFATGNVTWRAEGASVGVAGWGVYLSGANTDVTLRGPTRIAELMLFDGRAALLGTPGTRDARASATTIDVGRDDPASRAELTIRDATVGWFGATPDAVKGQITAQGSSRVTVERATCDALTLVTKGSGTITLRDIDRKGALELVRQGGPIEVTEAPAR